MQWERKDLKTKAKASLRRNRINAVIVCFVIAIIAGGYSASTAMFKINDDVIDSIPMPPGIASVIDEVKDTQDLAMSGIDKIKAPFVRKASFFSKFAERYKISTETSGVIATLIKNITGSSSFVLGILNTINTFVFAGEMWEGTIIALATIILMAFWLFVQNILLVGECRFFMETRTYPKSNVKRLTFVYRIKKTFHIAGIMFLRFLYTLLWSFTIVGGIYKHYSYRMIPFIIAENPEISRKEAFELSAEMMRGNKWKTFKLDLSFFFWQLLSAITLGVVGFLYVNPYLAATKCELYFELRENAIEKEFKFSDRLNDKYLIQSPEEGMELYPVDDFIIPEQKRKEWVTLDYDRDYSITSLIYLFFATCFIGWCWEVFLHLISSGTFINRGTLFGPWLPIYGVGSVLMVVLLKPFVKKPPMFFVSAFFLCGGLEYFTSWILEKLYNQRWWDYSNVFFNINGRVCLEGLLFFAAGGTLVVYVIAPLVDDLVDHIPNRFKKIVAAVLVILFTTDVVTSYFNPNHGEGISQPAAISMSQTIGESAKKDNKP